MLQRKISKVVVFMLMVITTILSGCTRRTITTNSETIKTETPVLTTESPIIIEEEVPQETNFGENVEETETVEPTVEPTEVAQSNDIIIDVQEIQEDLDQYYNGYYYEQLTETQKAIFLAIKNYNEKKRIGFRNTTFSDVETTMKVLELEDPYCNGWNIKKYEQDSVIYVKLVNQMTKKQENAIVEKANQIADLINGESQEEIIKEIYNWCTANIIFDKTEQGPNCRNLYGALVEKKSVCVGYAKAFAYLCSKKGIYSICVANKEHMWNYVLFDDKWYAVDTTWGQAGTSNYLMKGTEILNTKDHVPTQCTAPELEKKSLYPDEEKAKKMIKYFQTNLNNCNRQIQKFEKYLSDDRYQEYESTCQDILELYLEIRDLLTEMLDNISNTIYSRYLNTNEYTKKNKELQELIEKVNNNNW